jgi:hypothetical protein
MSTRPPRRPSRDRLVSLSKTAETEVALVVAQLARYGHGGNGLQDLASLVESFPKVAPGGISASDEHQEIHPSCCCGIEGWREWSQLLAGGHGPWLGHDPAPWVELHDGAVLVWPDGGLVNVDIEGMRPVRFSKAEFEAALVHVEADLRDFLGRLRSGRRLGHRSSPDDSRRGLQVCCGWTPRQQRTGERELTGRN